MSEVPLYRETLLARIASLIQAAGPFPRAVVVLYRGTSLIRNTPLLGPYSRTISGPLVVLGGGGCSL